MSTASVSSDIATCSLSVATALDLTDVALGHLQRQRREGNQVVEIALLPFDLLRFLTPDAQLLLGFQQILDLPFAGFDDLQQPILHRFRRPQAALQIGVMPRDIFRADLLALQIADAAQLEHERFQMLRRNPQRDRPAHLAVRQLVGIRAGDEAPLLRRQLGHAKLRIVKAIDLELHVGVADDLAAEDRGLCAGCRLKQILRNTSICFLTSRFVLECIQC